MSTIDPAHLAATPKRKRRIFPWVFLAVQAIFLAWIIFGVSGAAAADNCAGMTGQQLDACQAGSAVGSGIGFFLVIALWVAADFILGVGYLIFRKR